MPPSQVVSIFGLVYTKCIPPTDFQIISGGELELDNPANSRLCVKQEGSRVREGREQIDITSASLSRS